MARRRLLEYKSTMRWHVNQGEKASYIEDAVVKTIAGFANSLYGGTLLVGVTDKGGIYGLEEDYATFSKRGRTGRPRPVGATPQEPVGPPR